MKTEDIKKMALAVKSVRDNQDQLDENKKADLAKKLARAAAPSEKGKAAVTLPKAPFDIPKKEGMSAKEKMKKGLYASKLDPVDSKELKGKHKDRKDKDIDNDGDTDSSDEYLHKRRKAITKATKGQEVETQSESTIYSRILEKREGGRGEHYKGATKPDDLKDDDTLPGKGAKEMDKDMQVTTDKHTDFEKKGHDDAQKAARTGPSAKADPHTRGAAKGDKAIIPSATKVKEAFDAVYDTSTSPLIFEKTSSLKVNRNQIGRSADELGGSGSLGHGAHDLMHPDDESGASAYGHVDKKTKKFKAVQVKFGHSTSAQKVAKAMGHKEVGPHHHAIADYHNETNAKTMGQKAGDKA